MKTDEDVFVYFQRHGPEAQTQYFFLLPAVDAPVRLGPAAEPAATATEFFLRVVSSLNQWPAGFTDSSSPMQDVDESLSVAIEIFAPSRPSCACLPACCCRCLRSRWRMHRSTSS